MINLARSFYRQIDDSAIARNLSVTFRVIYMIKIENEIVATFKPKLYQSYTEDSPT